MSRNNRIRTWIRKWDEGNYSFTEEITKQSRSRHPEARDEQWKPAPMARIEAHELRLFERVYPVITVALCAGIIFFMLLTVAELPPFGVQDSPVNNTVPQRYIEKGVEETGAVNFVAGMILDYRAFDTLGESHVLYTATTAVLILMMTLEVDPEPKRIANIMQKDPILRQTARIIVPAAILYGIYIIFCGHLGPGGGFSGGAVIGGALILYAVAFGYDRLDKILNIKSFRTIVLCALCFYSCAKCYSFFCGANGKETIFSTGVPGAIFSAGLILPLNIAVGVVVACTMYGFYSLFQRRRI